MPGKDEMDVWNPDAAKAAERDTARAALRELFKPDDRLLRDGIRQLKARAETKRDDGNMLAANECDNCVMVLERLVADESPSGRAARLYKQSEEAANDDPGEPWKGLPGNWIAPFHQCPRCGSSLNWTEGFDVFDQPRISSMCCAVIFGASLVKAFQPPTVTDAEIDRWKA